MMSVTPDTPYIILQQKLRERGDPLSLAASKAINSMYKANRFYVRQNENLKETTGYNKGYVVGFRMGVQFIEGQIKEKQT